MHFITADKVFNGQGFVAGQPVIALNNDLSFNALLEADVVDAANVKRYEGIICPGFINAHCHLELSHLKGKITQHTGLPDFALEIIKNRNAYHPEEVIERMKDADAEMYNNGIVVTGDISNTALSAQVKQQSKILYHTFVELIGLAPQRCEVVFKSGEELLNRFTSSGLSASLAAHAPYSTSFELIEKIANFDSGRNLTFSIHNQESEEESLFFMGKKNGFERLYSFLNLDIAWYKAPKCSSYMSYAQAIQNSRALLVHNTVSKAEDVNYLTQNQNFWCFCPQANLYIENKLPDYPIFKNSVSQLCVGTDSLASNYTLNLVLEANTILQNTTVFSGEELLQMLTYNGAKALGLQNNWGQFNPGKNAGVNLIEIKNNQLSFIKKIA